LKIDVFQTSFNFIIFMRRYGSAGLPPEIPLVATEIPLGAVKILLVTTRHRDQWNKNPVGRDDTPSRARVYNMV
jgi:hypothetical protein